MLKIVLIFLLMVGGAFGEQHVSHYRDIHNKIVDYHMYYHDDDGSCLAATFAVVLNARQHNDVVYFPKLLTVPKRYNGGRYDSYHVFPIFYSKKEERYHYIDTKITRTRFYQGNNWLTTRENAWTWSFHRNYLAFNKQSYRDILLRLVYGVGKVRVNFKPADFAWLKNKTLKSYPKFYERYDRLILKGKLK